MAASLVRHRRQSLGPGQAAPASTACPNGAQGRAPCGPWSSAASFIWAGTIIKQGKILPVRALAVIRKEHAVSERDEIGRRLPQLGTSFTGASRRRWAAIASAH